MSKKLRNNNPKKSSIKYNKVKLDIAPSVSADEAQWIKYTQDRMAHGKVMEENNLSKLTEPPSLDWYSLTPEQTQLDTAKCNQMISDFQNLGQHQKSGVGTGVIDPRIRQVHQWNYETPEYFEFFQNLIQTVNDATWQYNITQIEIPTLCIYYGDRAGKYSWHRDGFKAPGFNHGRKISATILLNDATEFEGGALEIFRKIEVDGKPVIDTPVLQKAGDAVFFTAHDDHRVLPVTKGTRAAMVLWMWGPKLQ